MFYSSSSWSLTSRTSFESGHKRVLLHGEMVGYGNVEEKTRRALKNVEPRRIGRSGRKKKNEDTRNHLLNLSNVRYQHNLTLYGNYSGRQNVYSFYTGSLQFTEFRCVD